MLKAMTAVRTLFLVFITGYLLWEVPLAILSSSTRLIDVEVVKRVATVAWLAVGWIALETALGWARVWAAGRDARKKAAQAAPAPSPAAPPAP